MSRRKTAKEKFKKGDIVTMTPLGYQRLTPGKKLFGEVRTFSYNPYLVNIRLLGHRSYSRYYAGFWCKNKTIGSMDELFNLLGVIPASVEGTK